MECGNGGPKLRLKKRNGKPNGVNSQLLTSSNQGNSWPLSKPRLEMVERWGWAKKGFNMVAGVVKDLAVFCIARTYMRFLGTHVGCYAHMLNATQLHIHVSCYATACARTVRLLRGWGGGGGVGVVACVVWHTCWMLRCLGAHVGC